MTAISSTMTALPKPAPMSVDEYLAFERNSEVRHEFLGGELYAMSGASKRHNSLALNLASALRAHLGAGPCQVFMGDVKLRVNFAQDDVFYYPDLIVACDPADRDPYFVSSPKVVVEVLSSSTERVDRREKFLSYTRLPSLQEYILVDQNTPLITVFHRDQEWAAHEAGPDGTLHIPSIGFRLPVDQIYAGTAELPPG
jgi:Uma2 family endonuclease